MPYSGNPSDSELDAVRFWAQDTGQTPFLSDAEINYVISFYEDDATGATTVSPVLIAAACCDLIASKYVGWVNINADGVSYSGDQLQQRYNALAAELRKTEKRLTVSGAFPYVGGILTNESPPPGVAPPNFGIGMDDNPEGFRQDGGWNAEYVYSDSGNYYGPNSGDIEESP
jgi:hypothetical protein